MEGTPASTGQQRPVPKLNTFLTPTALANHLKKDATTGASSSGESTDKITSSWKNVQKKIRRSWFASLATLSPEEIRKNFFIETGRFFVFLILFSVITLAPRDNENTFMLTEQITVEYYVKQQFPDIPQPKTFLDINELDDLWDFLHTVFMPNTFKNEWYNGDAFTDQDKKQGGYLLLYDKVVGAIRFRQIRVKKEKCSLPSKLDGFVTYCYPKFSEGAQEKKPFEINGTRYDWHSQGELGGMVEWGVMGLYPGSGYIVDFPSNDSVKASAILEELYQYRWLDEQTRAFYIDLTIFNANLQLHSTLTFSLEMPASGGLIPTYSIRSQKLIQYSTPTDFVYFALEIIFICIIGYYIYEELIEMKEEGWSYLTYGWNYVDWANILCFIVVISLRIKHQVEVQKLNLTPLPTEYVNISTVAFALTQEQNINAFNGLLMWIKSFKYIHIFPKMKMLTRTLEKSANSVLYFLVMFFIIFLGFCMSMYLSMGRDVLSYSSLPNSMFTLFIATLGQFDFEEMRKGNRVLGPFFFISYMLLVFFVLANVFIAIINTAYNTEISKSDFDLNKVESAIIGFLKQKFSNLSDSVVRLYHGFKRDIMKFDKDGDGALNKQELAELKKQVEDKPELKKILEDADLDNDQELSKDETKILMQKLEDAQANLKKPKPKPLKLPPSLKTDSPTSEVYKSVDIIPASPGLDEKEILEYVRKIVTEELGPLKEAVKVGLNATGNWNQLEQKIEKAVTSNQESIQQLNDKIEQIIVTLNKMKQ